MITEVLVAAMAGLVVYALVKRALLVRLIDKIPGPPSLPLVGNALDFSGSRRKAFHTYMGYCKFGNGVSRIYLGLQPYCLLYKAHTVEPVLGSSTVLEKSSDYDYLLPWLGTGLLTASGSKWHARRKMLTPTFHFKILEDFVEVFNKQSSRLVKTLDKFAAGGSVVDIFPIITLCTLDVIMETAMGIDINAQGDSESDYVTALERISQLFNLRQTSPWLHYNFMFNLLGYGKQQENCLKVLHNMSLSAISKKKEQFRLDKQRRPNDRSDEAVLGKKKRLAFLDLLLEESEKSSQSLTDEDIREEVDTFMFEGHDTTAAAFTYTLFFLGLHPDIQERVYQELTDVLGDDETISANKLRDMRYLEACIKESLRLLPSVPMVGRKLRKPTVIDGYDIPAGTTLMVMIYAVHRDPDQFPDPLKYDPDRFLGEENDNRHPYAYVPFSAGPRNCIGQKFAMMEEKVVVASVLRNFELTSTQSFEELKVLGEVVLRPEEGVFMKLKKRSKQ